MRPRHVECSTRRGRFLCFIKPERTNFIPNATVSSKKCFRALSRIQKALMQSLGPSQQTKNASESLLKRFCSSRRLPIFTRRFQRTIFGTSELNFCVRNGNRWDLTVIDTDQFDWPSITYLLYFVQCFLEGRAFKTE